MTKRAPWPMVVPTGTTTVGTARVRDDARPTMTTAQRRIYEKTGNPPQTSALDDIDDPFASPALFMRIAEEAGEIPQHEVRAQRHQVRQPAGALALVPPDPAAGRRSHQRSAVASPVRPDRTQAARRRHVGAQIYIRR
jgi:hypothetical protein